MSPPRHAVRIVEVSPRDGLQNVPVAIPTATKLSLIARLRAAGLKTIELTSAVSPRAIPQLADCQLIMSDAEVQDMMADATLRAPILVPNVRGLETAVKAGAREVAVFVSATEGFSKANINCSVAEGLERARRVAAKARERDVAVRGYISCIFADPLIPSSRTPHEAVLRCVRELLEMGCYEVSLGDTTGVGVPSDVGSLVTHLLNAGIPVQKLAGHFHDTYGQAIANVWAAYGCGVRVFDSSVGGLGGCPFAPGAKGNLATEDLVYSLHQAGVETGGVDLAKLVGVGEWISRELGAVNSSRAGSALAVKAKARLTQDTQSKGDISSTVPPKTMKTKISWARQSETQGLQILRSGTNLKAILSRPQNGNALTTSMIHSLTSLFETSASDPTITRIAIASTGKFFCTGMDLSRSSSPVAQGGNASDEQYTRLRRLFEAIDAAPQVTIAAIQGPAFGGGVGLAFACDIRIMSANASMALSEVRLGLAPATISKYVVREWGVSLAREAMLSGRAVSAKELHGLGKVAAVVEEEEKGKMEDKMEEALDAYLVKLGHAAPRASALAKELVRLHGVGGARQEEGIKEAFDDMMLPGGESAYGLEQFQKGNKVVDWDAWRLSKSQGGKPKAKL